MSPTGIEWLDALIIPAIAVTALTVLIEGTRRGVKLARWLYRTARRVERFVTTWFGRDDEPGVPERLERIEWHVGNGSPVPLHKRVEDTQRNLDAHQVWSDEQMKALAQLRGRDEGS